MIEYFSAGVGRTGTYIALDILLEMLRKNNQINISECVVNLRRQRANMVQSKVGDLFSTE